MQQRTAVLRSEGGVSLLELAIILPMLLLLIAGTVDLGFKIGAQKEIVTASRLGARAAASHARRAGGKAVCKSNTRAADCSLAQTNIQSVSSITDVGIIVSCQSLQNIYGYNPKDWVVSSEVEDVTYNDGHLLERKLVSVHVRKIKETCTFCYARLFDFLKTEAVSRFVLEETCQ